MKVKAHAGLWTGLYLELITKVASVDHPAVKLINDEMQKIQVTLDLPKKDFDKLPGWFKHRASIEQ